MPPRTRSTTTTTTPAGRRPKVAGLRSPGRRGVTGESGPARPSEADDEPDALLADGPRAGTTAPGTTTPRTTGGDALDAPAAGDGAPADGSTAPTGDDAGDGEPAASAETAPAEGGSPSTTSGTPAVGKAADRDDVAARPTSKARRGGRTMTPSAPAETSPRRGGGTALLERPAPARPARSEPARDSRLGRLAASVTRPVAALGANPRRLITVLAVVLVLSLGLGTWAFVAARADRAEGTSYGNGAVVDVAGTAEVVGQTRQAVEQILSYDFTKLDDSVNAARSQATGSFASDYLSVFEQTIRKPATDQKLRQTATVLNIGVQQLTDDRATIMALVQFTAERTTNGQTTNAPGLLVVQVVKTDGRWKISELKPV